MCSSFWASPVGDSGLQRRLLIDRFLLDVERGGIMLLGDGFGDGEQPLPTFVVPSMLGST